MNPSASYIRLPTRADAATIGALRTDAFKASPDFSIENPRFMNQLNWTDEDDHAHVLSVWRDGQPVATKRVEMFPTGATLRYSSGLMPPAHHLESAFTLARVATHAADPGSIP